MNLLQRIDQLRKDATLKLIFFSENHPGWAPFSLFKLIWNSFYLAHKIFPVTTPLGKKIIRRWKRINLHLNLLEKRMRREKPISFPPRISLETTIKCNLRCPMCYRQHVKESPEETNSHPDMSPELFQHIARQLFPTAQTVNLSIGGEPLLVEQLDTILQTIERYDVKLDIITNGTLLSRKNLLEKIVPHLFKIEFSFDSTDAEQFERLRYPAKFDKVMANIERLAEMRREMPEPKFLLVFSFIAMRENIHQLPKVIEMLAKLGGDRIRVTPLQVYEEQDKDQSLVFQPELYNAVFTESLELAEKLGIQFWAPRPFVPDNTPHDQTKGVCFDIYESTFINFYGNVRPCCQFNPPELGQLTTENQFRKIWNGSLMRQIRRTYDTDQAIEPCNHCFVIDRSPGTVEKRKKQELLYLRDSADSES